MARFVQRHQAAIADLFGEVLALCARSGLAKVGVIAVDGTKMHANASRNENLDYEQLAREIVAEANAVDAAEDERWAARGDELPPESRPRGARGWLREAKQRLEQRAAKPRRCRAAPAAVPGGQAPARGGLQSEVARTRLRGLPGARGDEGRPALGRPPKPYKPPAIPEGRSTSPTPTHATSRGCAASCRATTRRPSPTSTRS